MAGKGLRNHAEVLRDEMVWRPRILEVLARGPATIPELADELGCPSWEVTVWLMGMRRHGLVVEGSKSRADDYYPYALVQQGGGHDQG